MRRGARRLQLRFESTDWILEQRRKHMRRLHPRIFWTALQKTMSRILVFVVFFGNRRMWALLWSRRVFRWTAGNWRLHGVSAIGHRWVLGRRGELWRLCAWRLRRHVHRVLPALHKNQHWRRLWRKSSWSRLRWRPHGNRSVHLRAALRQGSRFWGMRIVPAWLLRPFVHIRVPRICGEPVQRPRIVRRQRQRPRAHGVVHLRLRARLRRRRVPGLLPDRRAQRKPSLRRSVARRLRSRQRRMPVHARIQNRLVQQQRLFRVPSLLLLRRALVIMQTVCVQGLPTWRHVR